MDVLTFDRNLQTIKGCLQQAPTREIQSINSRLESRGPKRTPRNEKLKANAGMEIVWNEFWTVQKDYGFCLIIVARSKTREGNSRDFFQAASRPVTEKKLKEVYRNERIAFRRADLWEISSFGLDGVFWRFGVEIK